MTLVKKMFVRKMTVGQKKKKVYGIMGFKFDRATFILAPSRKYNKSSCSIPDPAAGVAPSTFVAYTFRLHVFFFFMLFGTQTVGVTNKKRKKEIMWG